MSIPFKRDFEAFGYEGVMDLPVPPDSSLVKTPAYRFLSGLAERELSLHRPWQAELGYLASSEKLGFTKLTLPLRAATPDYSLELQRMSWAENGERLEYLLPLIKIGDTSSPITTREDWDWGSSMVIEPSAIDKVLAAAGYGLPTIFTSPDDMRLGVAELADRSRRWSTSETVEIPMEEGSEITLKRHTKFGQNPAEVEKTGSFEAVFDFATEQRYVRRQMVLIFPLLGHFVDRPTAVTRQLQVVDKDIDPMGEPKILDEQDLTVNKKLLRRVAEILAEAV